MRFRSLGALTAMVAVSMLAYACASDSATAPPSAAAARSAPSTPSSSLLLSSPISVIPLARNAPLAAPITASATVGMFGGHLAIPAAGISIIVPPLAVSSPTTISVTALAGGNVAYEFAPHGIRFNVPLLVTQDLTKTQAGPAGLVNPLSLFVGYFPDATSVTDVTELLSVGVNLFNQTSTVTIWHFSGYMWASGRSASDQ